MAIGIGVSVPKLISRAVKSAYSVLGKDPKLVADFDGEYYRANGGKTTFSTLITHARAGNATMTDGYGPELVTNGTFDTDSGWAKGTGWTISGGVASGAATYSYLSQTGILTVGKIYSVTYTVSYTSGIIALNSTMSATATNRTASGTYTEVFVSLGTEFSFRGTNFTGSIDNISVREMPVIKWAPHNLFLYSEDVETGWTSAAVTPTSITTTLPDGSTGTAGRLQDTGAGSFYQSRAVTAGEKYTVAVWVKRYGSTNQTFRLTNALNLSVDLTATADWQLFELEGTVASTGTRGFGITDDAAGTNYDIVVWGLHLYRSDLGGMVDNPDRGDSYVPTTSSAVYLPRRGHHVYNGYAWVNEGVLAESEARTNLAPHSDMSSATLAFCTRTANAATSPDGSENAFKIEATDINMYATYNGIISNGESYAVSVYAKAGTQNIIRIANTSSATNGQWFDLASGTLLTNNGAGNTATIEDVGNGWYRCTRYFDSVSEPSAAELFISLSTSDGITSANVGDNAYFYGFQIENNATSSSYIPTSGSTVTRAAETFTIPSAKLPWPSPQYIGNELVTNGTFDTDSDWTLGTNASISGGKLNYSGGSGNTDTYQNIGLVAGKVYWGVFTVSNVTSGSVKLRQGGDSSGGTVSALSDGTYSSAFVVPSGANAFLIVDVSSSFEGSIDNISVREINPLSVSIQQQGRITYADDGGSSSFYTWKPDANTYIQSSYLTSGTDKLYFTQKDGTTYDDVSQANAFSPDILVPYSISSRHGSTFINGAIDGVALTANTTPTALPDLSATDLDLANDYMGTIKTFRIWDKDLGDTGIVSATAPSLEPSLSLSFDSTESSFIDKGWSE